MWCCRQDILPCSLPLGPWVNTVPPPGLHLSPMWFGLPVREGAEKPSLRCWASGNQSHYPPTLEDPSFLGTKGKRKSPLLSLLSFLFNLASILKWFKYFQQKTKPPLGKSGQRWPIPNSRLLWDKPLNAQVSVSSQTTSTSTSNFIIQYS